MRRLRPLLRRLWPFALLWLLPLMLFWPVLWNDQTMIPVDALYQGQPWASDRESLGVGNPHNELVSDLVLQNYQWKQFAIEQVRQGELPLWQDRQLSGGPFLAAGQHGMLYPLSWLFFVLPIHAAYGWFTVLSLVIAGSTLFLLARALSLQRGAALIAALTYQGSGFFTISVLFPMIISGAAWLPLLLGALYRARPRPNPPPWSANLLWAAVGAFAIGMAALAGHPEVLYYTLLIGAAWGLWLLVAGWRHGRAPLTTFVLSGLFALVTGLLIGAAQLVPLYETVSANFREGSAQLDEVLGYAWPLRQASSFVLPDLLGDPSRHDFYNLESRQREPIITQQPINDQGETANLDHVAWFKGTSDWKNYVEGAAYLGILPLFLALIGALWGRRRERWFFMGLAALSLLFIFGSPLYGLLFHTLPGFKQLHTPFRWLWPLTLAVALLAAMGWQRLRDEPPRLAAPLAALVALAGGSGLALLAAVWLRPAPWIAQSAKLLDASQMAQWAFGGSAALFLSYQWANFLQLGLALLGAGVALWLARRRQRWALPVAAVVLLLDLFFAARGFMPQLPVALAEFTPPSIAWLQDQHEPGSWRYTVLEKDWKVLNANSTMQYGLEDLRGYDSIILRPYVEFMRAVAPQSQLLFNRIAPLSAHDPPPDQALLDLLNVRYLATDQPIDWPDWTLAYQDEALRIYENENVLPRAFLLGDGTLMGETIGVERLQALEPRQELFLADEFASDLPRSAQPFAPAEITRYTANEITVRADAPQGAWLVLSEIDFPGWRAYVRATEEGAEEERAIIFRANGAFRAVWLDPGTWEVRWVYSPNSVKIGFFGSFLGVALLGLVGALWAWGRIYRPAANEDTARRVAKNSLAPMGLQLFNKAVDMVFAAFMARFLGPASLGQYAFAVAFVWYFIIFSNFGLGTLLTRDAARDIDDAPRLLNTTLLLRGALYLLMLPALALLIWLWPDMKSEVAWAIALLVIGLIPSNISDALTSVFRAHERFEIPALVATIATFVKVIVGAAALLLGYGIVGLAATSIVTNVVTLAVLSALLLRLMRPAWGWATDSWRPMLWDAFPLMVNEFLATAFFRIDQIMIAPLRGERGDAETGYYNVAYKFIDGLLILPSSFTLAIFPVMSRYAQGAPDALLRATVLSLRWLVMLALPIALLTTRYAEPIILAFGGRDYLPFSAVALQILIWFLPFSFVNGLLQYVLIAAGRQHALTRAFLLAMIFNLVANFFAIRVYGIYGAAVVTIVSEWALMLPFYRLLRESVGDIPWGALFGKPALALAAALLPLWWGGLPVWLAIPLAVALYGAALVVLRAFTPEDRAVLARLRG
ncbi:MAG: oligosaccharide flippase family protein [Anaerolineales bacterium]|nr:oligosaccharide flippase family protein [Anaerolineales bacterium]MCB9127355.1 oligosaccharide flippase family protein [Ardenticatenales bacterium]MCB9136744.1 oligosaccharide flippase family protein [Caldilineaceae bacterium]